MRIKIHNFVLLLLLGLMLLSLVLWSTSVWFSVEMQNQHTAKLMRDSWQQQLDQLQLTQRLWLQRRLDEVSRWMMQNTDAQQQLLYINQYYQRYPQIRLLQTLDTEPLSERPHVSDCYDSHGHRATTIFIAPDSDELVCNFKQRPVLLIGSAIDSAGSARQLLMAMDYFAFMIDFEKLSGKHLYLDKGSVSPNRYLEAGVNDQTSVVSFEFRQGLQNPASVVLALPAISFVQIWLRHLLWILPTMLLITLILYQLLFKSLLQPLFVITERMKKIVRIQRPGNNYEHQYLMPGLMLLHRYFMHMTHIVRHDPLTGLNNRLIFEERLKHAILEGKRTGRRYALVLVDINSFYKVNHTFGNYIGDGLLKQLAKRLANNLRETDSLARLEKDNFAFLLEFKQAPRVRALIEKIHQSLSLPYTVYGREVKVSISIGVAVYPDSALEREELELKANDALLKAHQGDWPVVYEQSLIEKSDYAGLSVIQSLHQALDNNDFVLFYQPVIDLKTHRVRYFEALLRWKQPEEHQQSIEKTILLAEKNQLIRPLSQWIIEQACAQLNKLSGSGVHIAVNLSMMDLHDDDLPERIARTIDQCGVTNEKLMIEITEGQIMREPTQVIKTLERLSSMGISLSIDDFGTGQASLTYLKKLPVEKLKIDQSFVKDMLKDEEDRAIVAATIQLAHTLGIEVVAEGVETVEVYQLLLQMGCDFVQGYYISRPIHSDLVCDWIKSQAKLQA